MTTQSKILKLSPKSSYYVTGWGIIKTSNHNLYYIDADKLEDDKCNCYRFWISENLYNLLNTTFTDEIDGYRKIIYNGSTKKVYDMYLVTEDEINTPYGKKIKYYVEIFGENDEINGVIYANYRGCNCKGVDMSKVFRSYFIHNFI